MRGGWLHPRHRGVYAVGTPQLTLEGLFLAAVKACGPEAVLSHYSAAALFGIVKWDGRYPEVTTPGRREHPGIHTHRPAKIDATRRSGIPVTTPARTLIDLAAALPYRRLRRAVRQAQSLKLVTLPQLVVPGRPGAKKLAKIIATGPAPTRSELEDVVLDLLLRAGFERPDVNAPLEVSGRTVYPDFRWPGQRLIIEADSRTWHDNKLAREDDAERQALLEAHGERVVRVTWEQAVARPGQTIRRIYAARAEGT